MALENKLGLTSSADLAREEERISKKKALELFESELLDKLEAGKFSALKAIHKYLFDEIYDFFLQTPNKPLLSLVKSQKMWYNKYYSIVFS